MSFSFTIIKKICLKKFSVRPENKLKFITKTLGKGQMAMVENLAIGFGLGYILPPSKKKARS